MSIHVALNHVTHYRYDRPVHLGPQVVRLRPAPHSRTRIMSYSMKVEPTTHFINWQQDPQANYLARLVFPDPTTFFRVEVDLVAEMAVYNPFDFFLEPSAEKFPFTYEPELLVELAPYLRKIEPTPKFAAYLASIDRSETPTNDFLVALNQKLQRDIAYLIRMEHGVQTPETTLVNGSGSCRDSGWLLVQLMRHLGLAARFVSGYLIQLKSDVKSLDGPSGTEVDFTDLHAWCEVFLPGAGWIGLDPTSGLFAGEGHIPLACSPEPSSAAPISGVLDPCETTFEHHMSVTRIWEAPRVTLPYSDAQWGAVDSLGAKVDADLQRHDVRLTQGGEPTFVSVDDREGGEWNTEAMGPTKRVLSVDLMERLRKQYGEGGLLHFGQGKWYPGEQLPRWSLNLFWRKDGQPVWNDPALFANERDDHGATPAHAEEFLRLLAARLKVDAGNVFGAYEDAWYWLWREKKLPSNVDPFDSRLADAQEKKRMKAVFERKLDQPVGYVLPVAPDEYRPGQWRSSPWYLRAERCFLIPGDSPVGFRLPLDSLPWTRPEDTPWVHAPDPTQDAPPLPAAGDGEKPAWHTHDEAVAAATDETTDEHATPSGSHDPEPATVAPTLHQSAGYVVRTAISAEPRHGRLYVFMPPASSLEDYLSLVTAVEATARQMAMPVVLEGYEPPRDPRLTVLRVTPDPGVIEVNIHPASGWSELVGQTTHLYDSARETRLTTEKFMLDGRHTGTGGGNHFVLGGATPNDSPFLRRPDLLASMIGYWHNHPALSYLFSGMFVGPTSQAPRIDEARNDSVYEIEVAFAELRRVAEAEAGKTPPWLIDRLLRNLLIDVTGNTHRAEFCIDKLYSPDGPTGRLGLLEMRAFEMPPHARMSLAQQLLMRALVARFWSEPYRPERLARWGTELHDRFMLPYFIWEDLRDVIGELRDFGYPFELDWFAAHRDFRFPLIGDFAAAGVDVELRMALEPWHVLGEESGAGGTARYVDSTLERIQVHVTGLIEGRHVLACNGRRVPLQPTGAAGEHIAAVRYRAWTAPSSLHPTIEAHVPLVFDIVDTWMNRSIGGCQYHVAHPGGINYVTFPVNALEAEARRLGRFFRTGHTPGHIALPPEQPNLDFPYTLDLRRAVRPVLTVLDALLADYPAPDDRYDELLGAPGRPRPHWDAFTRALSERSEREVSDTLELTERQIREHGITYNVYADAAGAHRPWEVDPIPLLLPADEWHGIAAGIEQRANLLNRVLGDLYGAQTLMKGGHIPPPVIFGHRGFLAPAEGLRPVGGRHLLQYAADLARSPDGRWWVVSDRTQAPSGSGYALENRLLVSRVFPQMFRELPVQHLAAFFDALRASLLHWAPRGDGPPRIVLLTPGPYNETYFEHALLARYLGFALVEGSDLTVRDDRVWLKTIDGLQRVHAIVRRQDDDYCDPLELRSDSALGIAGLTDCARRGSVLLANALGSGVLESGALLGYLPKLSRHLLGEELLLPSVATWWLGEPAAFADAWRHPERLIIKPLERSATERPIVVETLSEAERDALRLRLQQRPQHYVAQEWVHVSQAPVLERGPAGARSAFAARTVGLRVFAVATPSGWRVMPGGLTRVAGDDDSRVIAMQRGGRSKDTWVLSDRPVNAEFSLLSATVTEDQLVNSNATLPSRAAENLFWFGRYGERCDATARLLRVALGHIVDAGAGPIGGTPPSWTLAEKIGAVEKSRNPARALRKAATHPGCALNERLQQLSRVAFNLRDRMSADHWRTLNRLIADPALQREPALPMTLVWLDRAITSLMTLSGFVLDGMTRGIGWRFVSMGRRVERLATMCTALQVATVEGRSHDLDWLLDLADSSVTYRSRYLAAPEWLPVLDIVVREEANPRSLAFQAKGLADFIARLEASHGPFASARLAPAHEALRALLPADLHPESEPLAAVLEQLKAAAYAVSDDISMKFFSHAIPRSMLSLAA